MSSDHGGTPASPAPSHGGTGWITFGLITAILLVIVITAVVDRAINENRRDAIAAAPSEDKTTDTVAPSGEMPLPDGPHLEAFQNSCLTCHSARLPLGQPPFGREKWSEIVHKMTAVYGAPMTPEVESNVVDYIVAVRPPET